MINPVNVNPMVPIAAQNGAQKVMTVPQPVQVNNVPNADMRGADALASYNQTMVAPNAPKVIEPTLPTVLQPEAIHSMQGERIYSSSGELKAIGVNNGKSTTIYTMDMMAPEDAISKIETYDNQTGKLIKVQKNYNLIEEGKLPQTFYTEISELNSDGKLAKSTIYTDGKPERVREFEYGPNNYTKTKILTDAKEGLLIEEDFGDAKLNKMTRFDEKGQVKIVETHDFNKAKFETVYYSNGFPSRIVNETESPIPNTTGRDPMMDRDLIPAKPYILGYDPKQVQGERKNYSNGALENIYTETATGPILYNFKLDGTLESILDETNPNNKKFVVYNSDCENSSYSVKEQLADNVSKHTIFYEDGSCEVDITDDANKTSKYAAYNKEGKLGSYIERSNGESLLMVYNKDGELVSAKRRKE